jgi:Predicted secreted protein
MSAKNGSQILMKIKVGAAEKLLSGQVNVTHDLKIDAIETTTKLSTGGAKTFMAGEYTITYKVDCVTNPLDTTNATYSDVFAAAKAKTEIDYTYGGIVAGEKKYTGKAIIVGLSNAAPQNDKQTFSVDLQVTGEEVEGTVV